MHTRMNGFEWKYHVIKVKKKFVRFFRVAPDAIWRKI